MSSEDEPQVLADQVLAKIGEKNKKTVAQVVLRWILQRAPHTVVIPKSVSPARLDQNMQIFDFEISEEDMAAIDKLDVGRRYNDTGKYTDMNGSYWPIFG